MRKGKPVKYGEIFFHGSSVYERIYDASVKIEALSKEFNVKYIAIESAVLVNSAAVGIKLAYVFGAIMAQLLRNGSEVVEVKPLTWQSYIGNKSWTPTQKAKLKAAIPGKSASWYKGEVRKRRKQYTLDYFNKKFKLNLESDNVGDAFGVAYYLSENI